VINYVNLHNLQDEPAFTWWVLTFMQHKNHLIKTVTSRAVKWNVKFGIQIPKTVAEALQIDR